MVQDATQSLSVKPLPPNPSDPDIDGSDDLFAVPCEPVTPPETPGHQRPRPVGLVFIIVGLVFGAWVAHDARSSHFFSLRPFLSSLMIAMGLWMLIEAPELPARELSPLGHVFAGIGMVIGLMFTWYVMGGIPFIQ